MAEQIYLFPIVMKLLIALALLALGGMLLIYGVFCFVSLSVQEVKRNFRTSGTPIIPRSY